MSRIEKWLAGIALVILFSIGLLVWYFTPTRNATAELLRTSDISVAWQEISYKQAMEEVEARIRDSHPRLGRFQIHYTQDGKLAPVPSQTISLNLKKVPAWQALKYLAELGSKYPDIHPGWCNFRDIWRGGSGNGFNESWIDSYLSGKRPR
ncbi:MAG: hypothetical protein AAGA58_10960 [Verrucomicrobiota bacterium]